MPRIYKRKSNKGLQGGRWTQESLNQAINNVLSGQMSAYQASKHYKIPRSTLILKAKGWGGKRPRNSTINSGSGGKSPAISVIYEERLVKYLSVMNKWGFGLSKEEVKDIVQGFVQKNNLTVPFKNGRPGDDWWRNFKNRHKISLKKPERLEGSRSRQAGDPFIVNDFFDLLGELIHDLDLENKPEALWNCDETAFNSDPGSTKIVCKKGQPAKRLTGGSGRETTTVLACGNAKGKMLPPTIIHKGKRIWDSMFGGQDSFPETLYFATEKGWMTEVVFLMWFKKCFLVHVTQRPVILIYDGHLSHINIELLETALENDVSILKLPPHTSHILQPLDVGVFRGLKIKWDQLLTDWARHHIGQKLSKSEFSNVLGLAWKAIEPSWLVSGFKKTGIYDPDVLTRVNRLAIKEENYHPDKLKRFKEQSVTRKVKEHPTIVNAITETITEDAVAGPSSSPLKEREITDPSSISPLKEHQITGQSSNPLQGSQISEVSVSEDTPGKVFEHMLLEKIVQSSGKKTVKRRIDTAEIITKEEYISSLKKRKAESIKGKKKSYPKTAKKKSIKDESDSDEEIEDMTLEESDETEEEWLEQTATLKPVNEENIKQGSFIVATFKGGKRGITVFKYVCVIESFDETKDEIEVVGLRSVDKDKKSFVVNDKDRSFIRMSQIIGILLDPILTLNGERFRYTFNGKVDVFEC